MKETKYTGSEHTEEFKSDFIDRLARYWPEPREQIHAGGWNATQEIVDALKITEEDDVLDICCGEGATAVSLAKKVNRITGIDILHNALAVALRKAIKNGVDGNCCFTNANIFTLPFKDESFTVVYGQDPDGFAHMHRIKAFHECYRVLRPGGRFAIQHWIPGINAPKEIVEKFDLINKEVGYPSHGNVSADAYIQSMEKVGFIDTQVVDKSAMYRSHMEEIARLYSEEGMAVDLWTRTWLDLSKQHPFGIMLFGKKPI